jgi:hypothetical protein
MKRIRLVPFVAASIFVLLGFVFGSNAHQANISANGDRGYYFGIVSNGSTVRLSYAFHSSCEKSVAEGSVKKYAESVSYSVWYLKGPFETVAAVDAEKQNIKKEWKNSGYNLGGDFALGDCY